MSRQVNTTSGQQMQRPVFASRLHEALGNTTSESFARSIGKSWRTVQRWRSGESEPSGADLVLVAQTLKRDPLWFYDDPEAV